MSVLYSVGYAYGVAAVALVPVVLLVLVVPPLRRRLLTGPLRRLLARNHDGATLAYTKRMPPDYPPWPDELRLDSAPGAGDATAWPGTCPPELAGGPMETLLTWLAVSLAGLLVSAHVTVKLPVLGPTPVLAVVALAVVLALAAVLAWVVRVIVRDGGLRLRPGMTP